MTTRWVLPAVAALLLAACSSAEKPMPDPQCRQAALDDPQVRAGRAANAGRAGFGLALEDRDNLAYLQNDAYARCMRLRGLAPPGGVEQVRPY